MAVPLKPVSGQTKEYAESVKAMNGCLASLFKVFTGVLILLALIVVIPYLGVLLLCWWIVAWILGLIFRGKEFFPIDKLKMLYRRFSDWVKKVTGNSVEDLLSIVALVIIGAAIINVIGTIISKK